MFNLWNFWRRAPTEVEFDVTRANMPGSTVPDLGGLLDLCRDRDATVHWRLSQR